VHLLRDKDLEIEEYRNSGFKLSRPSLKTPWFKPEDFDQRPLAASDTRKRSCIETLSSSECNVLLKKAAAAKTASADVVDSKREMAPLPETPLTALSCDAPEETGSLKLPEPTHKRKVDKPDVKVSKRSAAQKKLMKL